MYDENASESGENDLVRWCIHGVCHMRVYVAKKKTRERSNNNMAPKE